MSREPGRVRWLLAEMLTAQGFGVSPYDLWVQFPYYARAEQDCARWGGYGTVPIPGDAEGRTMPVQFASWDTMTECVRNGISLSQDGAWAYEVHAKEEL